MLIRTIAQTHSTNDEVVTLARQGAEEGLWLRAERQTRGRGRLGREWQGFEGNLYASTLVRLRQGDPPAPSLALVASIALHEVATAWAPDAGLQIKWPNDLLAFPSRDGEGDRKGGGGIGIGAKLGGILLERRDGAIIIGFGVNLADHPTDTGQAAASLRGLTGSAPDPADFLTDLALAFAHWLERWRGEGLAPIRAQWLALAHPLGTALATTGADGAPIQGLFDGLDESGALRLRLADGSSHVIHAGDVFLV